MTTVERPIEHGERAHGDQAEQRDQAPAGTSVVGRRRPRPDSEVKVRGTIRYAADRPAVGVLHARPVLSPYAHALIRSIDTKAALGAPGVVAVLTAADLPIARTDDRRMHEPLARDEVVFAGQPVALVLAETPEAGADAAAMVEVDYAPLEAVTDPLAAMQPDSPRVRTVAIVDRESGSAGPAGGAGAHAAVGGSHADDEDEAEDLSDNVNGRHRFHEGDVDAALGQAAIVVEGHFTTSWVYQAYLEPQTATAWVDPDGILVVEASTQGTFLARNDLAKAVGLPPSRINVIGAPLGGAFGGKIVVIEPLVAAAALAVRRPVRLVFDRREDFVAANPAQGAVLDVRLGAAADGTLVGLKARLVFDVGAFGGSWVEEIAPVLVAGPYRWPAFDLVAYGVRTNRVPAGPYRAPGAPQTTFALETLIDELADRLGIDPIELRLRNAADEGESMVDGEPWQRIGLRECLAEAQRGHLWASRRSLPPNEGVGLAAGVWPGGKDAAAAVCRVERDGAVTVVTGVIDMTGTYGAFQVIAGETLGVPAERVRIVTASSAAAPMSPVSGGSTVTYSAGRAIRLAAEDTRRRLLRAASNELEIAEADLEIVDGRIRPRGAPQLGMDIAELAFKVDDQGREPLEGHATSEHHRLAPSAAVHVAHVRVDPETGGVTVLGYHASQDVGRALNPALVEGQMMGGAAQSVGWALHEALVYDDGGQVLSGSFLDYSVPGSLDVPPIDVSIIEVPSVEGPFGAKGIGEAGVVPGAAAIANAIAAATGARLRDLPMSAPRVWRAVNEEHPAAH
jgi:CO/xanthine dehydrogenase Mo-binding subunit